MQATICGSPGCGAVPVVQWRRRPTAAELDVIVRAEQARRDKARLLADPALPTPQFGPLPTAADVVISVYGCTKHHVTLAAAALVHSAACLAPDPAHLTNCCTPEPVASSPSTGQVAMTTLATGWTVPAVPTVPSPPTPPLVQPSGPATLP